MGGDGTFGAAALKLAGFAGAFLGWGAEAFWSATPAELGVVIAALKGEGDMPAPPDADTIAKMREAYPDG